MASPGRLLDHLRTTTAFKYDSLRWLILDEADRLLDMGFENDIKSVLELLGQKVWKKQSVLISATLRGGIRQLADFMLQEPLFVWDGEASTAAPGTTVAATAGTTAAGAVVGAKRKTPLPDDSADDEADHDEEDDDSDDEANESARALEDGGEGSASFAELFAARAQETAKQYALPKGLLQMHVGLSSLHLHPPQIFFQSFIYAILYMMTLYLILQVRRGGPEDPCDSPRCSSPWQSRAVQDQAI